MIPSVLLVTLLLASSSLHTTTFANAASVDRENEVKSILRRMESDALAFRDEIERVYSVRCETQTLTECFESNYNDCSSTFPNQKCMAVDELVISACGDGKSCNALWDKALSTVSIPAEIANAPRDNPSDPEVIESACYSRLAEPYMIDKYKDDEEFWSKYEVQPSWTYFGAHNGVFRKIPATQQEECGQYDPRRRPWFVAASSGPKDVVLIIDTSGSMNDYGRMDIAKEAAITIVDTLTVADRVAVVAFSSTAFQIGGYSSLIRATSYNKKKLIEAIKGLQANGGTNFYYAFKTAFDTLEQTIREEATSGCNVAVLFMTDGKMPDGYGENGVINFVNQRTEQLAAEFGRNATVFTFSLGQGADHAVTKSIACSTNGIWTPVDDSTGDLVTAMSSYYKLFALGLGEGGNEDFAAWVEPYGFANPAGKMGTTVSVPVFDRSVSPPLFLGVVGVDMYMDGIEQVLGENATSSSMLRRFVSLSTANCPKIELSECELDALRFLGGGTEATCGICNSTNYTGIVPEKCPFQSDLPNNLWQNTKMEGMSYTERACCESDGIEPSESCPAEAEEVEPVAIIGIVMSILVVLCCCCGCCFLCSRMQQSRVQDAAELNARMQSNTNATAASNPMPVSATQPASNVQSNNNGSGSIYDAGPVPVPAAQPISNVQLNNNESPNVYAVPIQIQPEPEINLGAFGQRSWEPSAPPTNPVYGSKF